MRVRSRAASVLALATVAVLGAVGVPRAEARMTILYDVASSMEALLGVQSDGSPGLRIVEDNLYQQVTLGPLPADRRVGALTGGVGSLATPSIRGLAPGTIANLARERVDLAGAGMTFIDLGPDYDAGGSDGENLAAAMDELAASPFPGGGTYADRVHFYVSRVSNIATPEAMPAFWRAMSLTAGVWLEAYQLRDQWPVEYWLAWPRALRDGLVARGMNPARIHVIVRGANQAAVWANFRTGAACELLANGPGAYRIEDHLGFVQAFRATFGDAPAPPGPSTIACTPAPVLPVGPAAALADVLGLEAAGAAAPLRALSATVAFIGRRKVLRVALGPDPFGIAASLGADRRTFWQAAGARVTATGPGISTSAPVASNGVAFLELRPTARGRIALSLTVDGVAIRQAIGTPVDLALTLAPHRARVAGVLNRAISQPTLWGLEIPIRSRLRAVPIPPAIRARVLRRHAVPRTSLVELRLSRASRRLLVEVGVLRRGRYVAVRRLRMSGVRAVVPVRIPAGLPIRARVVLE